MKRTLNEEMITKLSTEQINLREKLLNYESGRISVKPCSQCKIKSQTELKKKSTVGDFDYSPDVTDTNVEKIIQMTFKSQASKKKEQEMALVNYLEDKENNFDLESESFLRNEKEVRSRGSLTQQVEEKPNVLGRSIISIFILFEFYPLTTTFYFLTLNSFCILKV